MAKFKVGFTITSEELFRIIAKFIPIEDNLEVEEIMPEHTPRQMFERSAAIAKKLEKPKKQYKSFKHESGKTLTEFIHEYIKNNPKHLASWNEMSKYSVSLGFNKSSINNAVARLAEQGLIKRIRPGKYALAEVKIQKSA